MRSLSSGSFASGLRVAGEVDPGDIGKTTRGPRSLLRNLLTTMRPQQWVKNALVFVAPASAGSLGHPFVIGHAFAVFAIFCVVASAIYLFNDTVDSVADQLHPSKRLRPISTGALSSTVAIWCSVGLIVVGFASAWFVAHSSLLLVMATYVAVSAAYTLRLKREPVIEMAAVASGFVLRAIAGGVATHVPLSSWFLVVTSFGALFVVAGKRAAELEHLGETGSAHRAVLADYTPTFLQSTLILTATGTVTTYCLWAFERGSVLSRATHHFVWIQLTAIPIVIGVLYVLRLLSAGDGGAPEDLVLRDHVMQVLGLIWVALFAVGLYG
jgi:decaprenyl-phosphate phosphoribosyltransferase